VALRISVEKALERAREVQPPDSEINSLRCLPDGQWVAVYLMDSPPVQQYKRTCYERLECPLFNYGEI